jgi:hypothetical protein
MLLNKNTLMISLVMVFFMTLSQSIFAAQVDFKSFKLTGKPPQYKVVTSVSFELTDHMRDALLKGIALKARIQFRLGEHRNWWFNGDDALKTIHFMLKYHALSQHYLLSRLDTDEHWNFTSLSGALRKLGETRSYKLPKITESAETLKEDNYYIFGIADIVPESLRLPLKIQSLFSDEYSLTSEGVLWPLP